MNRPSPRPPWSSLPRPPAHPPPGVRWGYQPGHVPLERPPWLRLRRTRRPLTRLRLWWRRLEYRAGEWLTRRLGPPDYPERERMVLHLLIVALTLIVLFQMVVLILTGPR